MGVGVLAASAALIAPGGATGAVVFHSDRCTEAELLLRGPDCDFALWRADDQGTGLRRLTPQGGIPLFPSFAARGALVVYRRDGLGPGGGQGPAEVWRVGSDGTGARRLAGPAEVGVPYLDRPDAAPVGREVVFSASEGSSGTHDLFAAGLDGGHVRRLTNNPGIDELGPKLSPDGTKVAFYRGRGPLHPEEGGLYALSLSGGSPVPLVVGDLPGPDYGGYVDALAWSPDGRALAFSSRPLIYSMTADGRGLRIVGNFSTGGELAWLGSGSPSLLISAPDLPIPADERRSNAVFGPGGPGARPLYRLDLQRPVPSPRPFTPPVYGREAQESFSGDGGPDWTAEPRLSLPDILPPAVDLVDGVDGRFVGRSRARRRGRKRTVSARRLSFLAADTSGVRRVRASVGKRTGRRGGEKVCRFATGRRATPRRRCSRPVFVRLRSAKSLSRLAGRLGRGALEIRLRASDRRGNRTRRSPTLSLRVGR